jgi:hypothetical protein
MAATGQFPPPSFVAGGDGTCFNTGRQGAQPLCILLIDGVTVAIKGKRDARSTSITGRHGRRPWHPQRATTGRRSSLPKAVEIGVISFTSCKRDVPKSREF